MPESYDGFRLTTPTVKAIPFLYSSKGVRTHGTIRSDRCNLIVLSGLNTGSNDVVFQLFEEPPTAGSVPAWVVGVPKRGQFSWVPAQGGRVFQRLYYGVSSTAGTYTPVGEGFWVDAEGVQL